jgi:hypothetical protein
MLKPPDADRMAAVEDALRTMPPVPAPPALRAKILRRVRAPKFVFPWLEASVSLMVSTLLTGCVYLALAVPPASVLCAVQSVRLFFLLPANRPYIAAAMPGLAMLAVCGLLAIVVLRPRGGVRRPRHR